MCSAVLIRDGDPWWLSPDIWTVPGADPNGPKAIPAAGEASFVWAKVENTGRALLENIQLNYYWSNPATGVLRSNSMLIGTSFASVPPGESREVLCLSPWVPAGVNGGHECLVVEAIHPADPLPDALPDAFDPPNFHQVAQRNIDLVRMLAGTMRSISIQVAAPPRIKRQPQLMLRWETKPLPDDVLETVGVKKAKFEASPDAKTGLSRDPAVACESFEPEDRMVLDLAPGERASIHLQIAAGKLSPNSYSWLSVVDSQDDKVFGGISFILTGREG